MLVQSPHSSLNRLARLPNSSPSSNLRKNYFHLHVHYIPHYDKRETGGEDSFYANQQLLAVADGVGGWAERGVDPALFSRQLCKNTERLWKSDKQKMYENNPKELIIDASFKTQEDGSATFCLITLSETLKKIYTSYIGDSGYVILRRNQDRNLDVVFQSPEQQHYFNYPYQLGKFGVNSNSAVCYEHGIEDNDIVVAGTDGLFDNLSAGQIAEILSQFLVNGTCLVDIKKVTEIIAWKAYYLSINPNYLSPFSKKSKSFGRVILGGKDDDITVIVAQIKLAK